MREIYLIVKGKVQGVFFRATVKEIAEDLQLCGYAKNLIDGSVEVVAQGSEKELLLFLKMIKQSPGNSQVTQIKEVFRDQKEKLLNFKIL